MDQLKDFGGKDTIEQIITLDIIRESGAVEALPDLLELLANPLGDNAVDEMVYHATCELLHNREADLIGGLRHASVSVRLLCIRQAGDDLMPATLPVLTGLLNDEASPEMLAELLHTLAKFKAPSLVETLIPYLRHEDEAVAGLAMEALAATGDVKAKEALLALIKADLDAITASGRCDLRTAMVLNSLASFRDEEINAFLISHIHHPTPSFRKVVISTLAAMGAVVLPALEQCLEQGGKDERIMAANIIGMTGQRKGADILVAQFDKGGTLDSNLRFAIYEALGRINSLRSIIGLADGLAEEDELVLIAVVTSLNDLCNPGVVKNVNEALAKGGGQSQRIMQAMVTARAGHLFRAVYEAGEHAAALIETARHSGNQEALAVFRAQLGRVDGDQAAADRQRLEEVAPGAQATRRVLAADDSKAILSFYKAVAADMGIELITANDGQEAFDFLQGASNTIDLLVTDMNMPNMDGIELTRALRQQAQWTSLPILMATTESEKSQTDIAAQAGVNGFISKPFTKEQFKDKLATMFA